MCLRVTGTAGRGSGRTSSAAQQKMAFSAQTPRRSGRHRPRSPERRLGRRAAPRRLRAAGGAARSRSIPAQSRGRAAAPRARPNPGSGAAAFPTGRTLWLLSSERGAGSARRVGAGIANASQSGQKAQRFAHHRLILMPHSPRSEGSRRRLPGRAAARQPLRLPRRRAWSCSGQPGISTVSMAWRMPLSAATSAMTTVASLTLTPLLLSTVRSLPCTVVALLTVAASAAVTLPARTW